MKASDKIKEIIGTILGSGIMAIGVSLFLLPNQLSTGGFSGIATIAYYIFNIPLGVANIILNIPLFLIALYKLGTKFIGKSIIGTISLSIFIDLFDNIPPLTEDRFLACIYGGIVIGFGTAIVLKMGASTGGTDLVSNVVRGYKPTVKMGNIITTMDIVIVILNVLAFRKIEIGLYSAIAIFLMGKIIDVVFEGINFTKMLIIISDKSEEISKTIQQLERGVTGLYGKGMYSEKDKLVLICATARKDLAKVRKIAQEIDKNSFIIITNAREVYGKGFK